MATLKHYSGLDRVMHRVAFAAPGVQITAAEIENRLFRRELAEVETGAPIFIASLPRAGTTILLHALDAVPELATSHYCDMPFIMAPMLWSRLSGHFRKPAILHERAHGDGIAIGYDSPEAFEEVIWCHFWPEHFRHDGTALWDASNRKREADDFIGRYFRKIVALRCASSRRGRYLSKNNANIARLDLLLTMFPKADILVPLRRPMAQAISLWQQDRNFLKLHAVDPFARRYMKDLGHFEFGALHRPFLFDNYAALTEGLTPADLDYWLAYWIVAFEHLAHNRDRLHIIEFEKMARCGAAMGADLCALLDLDRENAAAIGAFFRPIAPRDQQLDMPYSRALRDRAEALHARLVSEA